MKMDCRFFTNPYDDYKEQPVTVDTDKIKNLIKHYVQKIIENTTPNRNEDQRGDLYVGDAGIAYMFLRLSESAILQEEASINNAVIYIKNAKQNAKSYSKSKDERCAFLCGNAGIYAVSAIISSKIKQHNILAEDLKNFESGFEPCKPINFSKYGSDEILVGRAGYLSGVYWLNTHIQPKPFNDNLVLDICQAIVDSGRQYSKAKRSPVPLMYQYHETEYLGAAHGICAILHMLLESPWFNKGDHSNEYPNISKSKFADIKNSIDIFMGLQEEDGNFPVALESVKNRRKEKRLVHWCHGAPGAIYLLAKAYLVFNDENYLTACKKAADLVWEQGLLYKGPGICHGVAGNGYVFLILFRLTQDQKYLYRANKFMEFLTNLHFIKDANKPDRPFSLYEGLAGTVCFLIDLIHPESAQFPFMNIF